MADKLRTDGVRRGLYSVWAGENTSVDSLLEVIQRDDAEILKETKKSCVRRLGDQVIKESTGPRLSRLLRHTFRGARYRQGWEASLHLAAHGVLVPEALGFVEKRALGISSKTWFVTRYLEGYRNVEDCMRAIIQRGGGQDTLAMFLDSLADAVNRLTDSGAYHGDLSGKNILTRDGEWFYFIDLDAVEIGGEYTDEKRKRNHVQLYDSFCDELSDALLVPFITRMLSDQQDPRVWMPSVRKEQSERRRRVTERWEREGRLPAA